MNLTVYPSKGSIENVFAVYQRPGVQLGIDCVRKYVATATPGAVAVPAKASPNENPVANAIKGLFDE